MGVTEKFLFHCGPTLSGVKPSNLFSLSMEEYKKNNEEIHIIYKKIRNKGLEIVDIYRSKNRLLIFVFNIKMLNSFINTDVKDYLHKLNYSKSDDIKKYLYQLLWKIKYCQSDFPDEIGFFLGIPYLDVVNFIVKKGKNSVLDGYWKVYQNPEQTQSLFKLYDDCRKSNLYNYKRGTPFHDLIVNV